MVRQGKYTKKVSRLDRFKWGVKRRWQWFKALSWQKKLLLVGGPILVLALVIPLATYAYFAKDIGDKERLMNRNNTGIVLLDKEGDAFFTVGRAKKRDLVTLANISDSTEQALIAAEDKNFYDHNGFSIVSILGALYANITSRDVSYGGSTLTQQLAKNTLLSDDRTFLRKYQELAVSIAIEREYSKDEILEMYLNSAFFGENTFGIQDAAQTYFGKQPSELSLAESSMLIGLLPAPNAYSPISGNPEYAKERQNTVLTRMVDNGYITAAEKESAQAQTLAYAEQSSGQEEIAPHFVEMVINELSEKYTYEKVMRSGYQVKTTLDRKAQQQLSESVAANMVHINANGGTNASGVVIDPKTGEIRALVGSADYNNTDWGKVNMATTERQPGSSFKPIYYSYALADGVITPSTITQDKPINLSGWQPKNADGRFRGDISVRRALSQSLNIPSIEVMQKYGVDNAVDAANSLGIESVKANENHGLSLALGSDEVPLIQMANAYAAFANEGLQFKTSTIKEVDDKFNKKIFVSKSSSKQAISPEGAFLISNILSDNSARAPIFGSSLTVSGHTAAVKTGTTDENKDAWTIGYNPEYVVGIWVGNNDNTAMRSGGSDMAGPIWRRTMNGLLAGKPDAKFTAPTSIVQKPTCANNGGIARKAGTNTYNEYYLASAIPTTSCEAEVVKIEVCNLQAEKMETIDEDDFDEAKHSRNASDCQTTISVCDTTTGRIVTIEEDDFDSTKHSRETTNCQIEDEEPQTISVCDTTTGRIVTIEEDDFDSTRYSRDTTDCRVRSGTSNGTGNGNGRGQQGFIIP